MRIISIAFFISTLLSFLETKAQAPDLFFSHYYEGAAPYGSAVSIYNGTGSDINLDSGKYEIWIYNSGLTSPGSKVILTGILPDGDVYIVSNPMVVTFYVDLFSEQLLFSGDDAIALVKDSVKLDVIGKIGQDPGTMWSSGGVQTRDASLVRKKNVFQGDTTSGTVFLPSEEWLGFPLNDTTYQHRHEYGYRVDISGGAGWRMLSLPKSNGSASTLNDDVEIQGITDGSNSGSEPNIYYNPGSDGTGGWVTPTDINTGWGDGLGYLIYFFDNTVSGNYELPLTLDVDGSEPTENVVVSLGNTYTLVGNPFAREIFLDSLTGDGSGGISNGLKSPVYVWDAGQGSYSTHNFGGGQGNIVSPWQGFFIERRNANNLTIPYGASTDTTLATIQHFSKARQQNWREIQLHLTGEGFDDYSTKMYFSQASDIGEDGFDGSKLIPINQSPYLAFLQNFDGEEKLLVQDSRPYIPTEEQVYNLILNDMGFSGDFTLAWPSLKNIPADWELTISDLVSGATISMRDISEYKFNVKSKKKKSVQSILAPPEIKAKLGPADNSIRFVIKVNVGVSINTEHKDQSFEFLLSQNYPNPFNPETNFSYSIPGSGFVTLEVYNSIGQRVAVLVDKNQHAGNYTVNWNAHDFSSGVYYYRLSWNQRFEVKTFTLIK